MKVKLSLAIIIFILASLMVMGQEDAYAKEYKIGYVDLAKVFDEYTKTKEFEKALDEKGKAIEAEIKKMDDEITKLRDELRDKGALLSDKAKSEKQTVIDEKRKTLQDLSRRKQEEFLRERNEKLREIHKDIEDVVKAYSKETGYDFILVRQTLIYGAEQSDLTNEVLNRLNKK